ncbi:MAG: hypothetical protein MAG715_00001 [Methanonatronarchaeales archaeon]|nr:hypothetical protein [Methanonatronarchaeales archaeon]
MTRVPSRKTRRRAAITLDHPVFRRTERGVYVQKNPGDPVFPLPVSSLESFTRASNYNNI